MGDREVKVKVKDDLEIGHYCPDCGALHIWPMYLFAHWEEEVDFTCQHCDCLVFIQSGFAWAEE